MRHIVVCRLYKIFSLYLINVTIFEEKLLNIKCVFWFSLQLLSETFLIARGTERDMIKYTYIYIHIVLHKYCLFLLDFNELDFYRQIFEKYSNIKFHENPSIDIRFVSCGLKDWDTDVTKLRVAFRSFANKPKNLSSLVVGNNIATGYAD